MSTRVELVKSFEDSITLWWTGLKRVRKVTALKCFVARKSLAHVVVDFDFQVWKRALQHRLQLNTNLSVGKLT